MSDTLRALEAIGWALVVIAAWWVGRLWLGLGGTP